MSTAKYIPLSLTIPDDDVSSITTLQSTHNRENNNFMSKSLFVTLLVLTGISFICLLNPSTTITSLPSPRETKHVFPEIVVLPDLLAKITQKRDLNFFLLDEDSLMQAKENRRLSLTSPFASFGIIAPVDEDFDGILTNICKDQETLGCRYMQKDEILVDGEPCTLVTHIFLESPGEDYHIVIFREMDEDALLVKKLTTKGNITPRITFSNSTHGFLGDEVYDKFSLTPFGDHLFLPKEIDYFLFEKKHSRFIDCNRELAKNYTEVGSPDIQRNTKQSVIQMKMLMKSLGTEVWLMSGSLLGWYRECKAIIYTTDADFGTWSTYATPEFEERLLSRTLSPQRNKIPFRIYYIFGRFDLGYETSFLLRNNFKTDLFFLYPEPGNQVSSSGHIVSKRIYYKYFYPSFDICSSIFLGVKVNVPCEPEIILTAEYGINWKTPIKDADYDYKSSPNNRAKDPIPYPSDLRKAVRIF